jgi:hypothetical protein
MPPWRATTDETGEGSVHTVAIRCTGLSPTAQLSQPRDSSAEAAGYGVKNQGLACGT